MFLAFFATKTLADMRRAAFGRRDPGTDLPGRIVADVLRVATLEVSHPNSALLLVEGLNPALDCFAHRASVHPFRESVHAKRTIYLPA